jgi:hypothetical protein
MEEDVAAGTLTAKTHWRDYCMKVINTILFYSRSTYVVSDE